MKKLLYLIAFFALLVGCGGSGETDDSTVSPTDSPAATEVSSETAEPTDAPATSEPTEEPTEESTDEETTSGSADTTGLTSDYLGDYQINDETSGTMVMVTVDEEANTRTIISNALPNHEIGEFPNQGNPNTMTEQEKMWTYTTEPTYVGNPTPVRETGVAVNGVKFEPGTGESAVCETGEMYRIEAIQDFISLGLDFNNAHVQPTGEYHYHGVSELLADMLNGDEDLVHVGFAGDGHLIYFSKSGAYETSYRLGEGEREGENCFYPAPPGSDAPDTEFGPVKDGVCDT